MNHQQLQKARIALWRQNGSPMATYDDAAPWLEEIGFCLFLPRHAQLPAPAPSFVEACHGQASMTPPPPAIAAAMELATRLVDSRRAVPLNLLGAFSEQPDFLATPEVLPWVAAIRGERNWKVAPGGRTAPIVLRTWEALETSGGQTAVELREGLGREVTEAVVLRALIELWGTLRAVPTYTAGEPTRWNLMKDWYASQLATGANSSQTTALSAMLSIYLRQAVAATAEEAEIFLSPLTARSRIREVLHGMTASRSFGSTTVGTDRMLFVEGSLPEFPEEEETPTAPAVPADGGDRRRQARPQSFQGGERPRRSEAERAGSGDQPPRREGRGQQPRQERRPERFAARGGERAGRQAPGEYRRQGKAAPGGGPFREPDGQRERSAQNRAWQKRPGPQRGGAGTPGRGPEERTETRREDRRGGEERPRGEFRGTRPPFRGDRQRPGQNRAHGGFQRQNRGPVRGRSQDRTQDRPRSEQRPWRGNRPEPEERTRREERPGREQRPQGEWRPRRENRPAFGERGRPGSGANRPERSGGARPPRTGTKFGGKKFGGKPEFTGPVRGAQRSGMPNRGPQNRGPQGQGPQGHVSRPGKPLWKGGAKRVEGPAEGERGGGAGRSAGSPFGGPGRPERRGGPGPADRRVRPAGAFDRPGNRPGNRPGKPAGKPFRKPRPAGGGRKPGPNAAPNRGSKRKQEENPE